VARQWHSAINSPIVKAVRGRGLWAATEISPDVASAREFCERLLAKGVLSKETHKTVVRLAPPLVISSNDLDWALDRLIDVTHELESMKVRQI
jgi:ornithine--oxo-acid transaminase